MFDATMTCIIRNHLLVLQLIPYAAPQSNALGQSSYSLVSSKLFVNFHHALIARLLVNDEMNVNHQISENRHKKKTGFIYLCD